MTEGRTPFCPFFPALLQTLMQLVVNSSGAVLTVYFSGFKKKNQKILKKSLKSKKQNMEGGSSDRYFFGNYAFF